MLEEFKKLLNALSNEFGTRNEVVVKVSQHVDKLVLKEQKNILKKYKK